MKSHFFGFQSSRRSLFTNLLIVTLACLIGYYAVPRYGFLRAVYNNTALTTAALVLIFLVADAVVPFVLKTAVCRLSLLRAQTMFLWSKVKA